MRQEKGFADFVEKIIAGELAPREHLHHPDEEAMLDDLAGTLAPETRARLMAHLATCASCRSRWERLSEEIEAETARLMAQSRVPSLSAMACKRRRDHARQTATWGERARAWLGALTPRFSGRPVLALLATAVATVAVTLSLAIPPLRALLTASNRAVEELAAQVTALSGAIAGVQSGISNVSQQVSPLPAAVSAVEARLAELEQGVMDLPYLVLADLAANRYVSSVARPSLPFDPDQIAHVAGSLPDPAQRALYVVTTLQAHGILDLSRLDWGNFRAYEALPGESWAEIATFALGKPQLWPLVWVLNSEIAGPFDPLPRGASVRVPSAK